MGTIVALLVVALLPWLGAVFEYDSDRSYELSNLLNQLAGRSGN
jgi:hypothetical protein